jgi:hypothetical protein
MPLNKDHLRRAMFLTSTPSAVGYTAPAQMTWCAFPEFEDTIAAAGPRRGPVYEREKAAVAELARRLSGSQKSDATRQNEK